MKSTPFVMIARYLLLDRLTYLVLPWAWAVFGFVLDVVIVQLTPAGHTSHRWVGGLAGVFIVVFVLGIQSVARALPFGLALGVSRRTYFLGATSLAAALAAGYGLMLALGQAVERATGGWAGLGHFFTTISAAGVTAVLAVAAAALLAGGFATIRRLAV